MVGMGLHMDYCKILGVCHNAGIEDIKRAYRQAALRWHPDKNPNDRHNAERRFKEIAVAYEALSNSSRCPANLSTSRAEPFDVESAYKLFESVFEQHPETVPACEAAEALLAQMQSLDFAQAMFQFCQEKIKKIEEDKAAEKQVPKTETGEELASTSAGSSHSSPRSSEKDSPCASPCPSTVSPRGAPESDETSSYSQVATFREIMEQLNHEDPECVLVVRGIQKFGFESREVLIEFFGATGALREVLISHKHIKAKGKTRSRPASSGFVIMRDRHSANQITASAEELNIHGVCVKIQKFERE